MSAQCHIIRARAGLGNVHDLHRTWIDHIHAAIGRRRRIYHPRRAIAHPNHPNKIARQHEYIGQCRPIRRRRRITQSSHVELHQRFWILIEHVQILFRRIDEQIPPLIHAIPRRNAYRLARIEPQNAPSLVQRRRHDDEIRRRPPRKYKLLSLVKRRHRPTIQ